MGPLVSMLSVAVAVLILPPAKPAAPASGPCRSSCWPDAERSAPRFGRRAMHPSQRSRAPTALPREEADAWGPGASDGAASKFLASASDSQSSDDGPIVAERSFHQRVGPAGRIGRDGLARPGAPPRPPASTRARFSSLEPRPSAETAVGLAGSRAVRARTAPDPGLAPGVASPAGAPPARFVRVETAAGSEAGIAAGIAQGRVSIPVHTNPVAAAMDSWRVLAEDGTGLRFVPVAGGHHGHGDAETSGGGGGAPCGMRLGFLPLSAHVRALASWGAWVYAALEDGSILRIDATRPENPLIMERIPRGPQARPRGVRVAGAQAEGGGRARQHDHAPASSPVESLAAQGSILYVLTRAGLEIIERENPGLAPRLYPEVHGLGIRAEGRRLRVTGEDGATLTYHDTFPAPLRFEVAVNNNFFTPQTLAVAVGDTVRWSNLGGHMHNVFACTSDQTGCTTAAAETFQSGAPTGFFVYDHIFVMPGDDPYICQPHAPFMVGTVTVSGSTGAPSGVPDGTTGAAMSAAKQAADGSTISVSWDTTICPGTADHQILFGYPYGLPSATGGNYEPAGSRCAIGATSPFVWTAVPPAFPGPSGLLWWLIVATDGAVTEGSWGKASSGLERQGPGADGSSLECGMVQKSVTNTCGH